MQYEKALITLSILTLLGQETLVTLLESGLYKCYHCTILLTKLNNQNFIFSPVKLKQPSLGEGGVIFLAVLDRVDPNPYLCTYSTFKRVGFHSCTQVGFLVFFNLPLLGLFGGYIAS